MKTRLIFLLTVALLAAAPAWGQRAKVLWTVRHEDVAEGSQDAVVDSAGNVVVARFAHHKGHLFLFTARYAAANGALLWERRFRFDGETFRPPSLSLDAFGNVLASVVYYRPGNIGTYKVKYAAVDGATLWQRVAYPTAELTTVDGAGNILGVSADDTLVFPLAVSKYAGTNGKVLWKRDTHGDAFAKVLADSAGNAICVGSQYPQRFATPLIAKYAASNGALLWENRSAGFDGYSLNAALDVAGNVAVIGFVFAGDGVTPNAYYIAKHAAADGALIWSRRYSPVGSYGGTASIATDSAGNVVITANSSDQTYTAKYAAADGGILWQSFIKQPPVSYHSRGTPSVALDGGDNVIVSTEVPSANGFSDIFTAKYAPDGELIWKRRYDGPFNLADAPTKVVAGPGYAVVAGATIISRGTYSFNNDATIKYVDGPTPETVSAQVFSATIAFVTGSVNPNGFTTTAAFEYSLDPLLAGAATSAPFALGRGKAAVRTDATLTGLEPNRTYYYRAIGTGNTNTTRGAIRSFTTPRQENDLQR